MPFLLACIGLLAASTPWIVVRVAASRAGVLGQARGAAPALVPAFRRLNLTTLALGALIAGSAAFVTPPSLTFAALSLGAFGLLAVLGFAALNAIDAATHQTRVIDTAERVASLRPRELGSHLSLSLRLVPYALTAVGLAMLAYQLQPMAGRRLFMAVAFAGGAVVFLFLYAAWMREEVSGGQAEGGRTAEETRRRVRRIFVMQTVLVTASSAVANVLAGLDWTRQTEVAVLVALAGAVVGVIGCANALASGLTGRRYPTSTRS